MKKLLFLFFICFFGFSFAFAAGDTMGAADSIGSQTGVNAVQMSVKSEDTEKKSDIKVSDKENVLIRPIEKKKKVKVTRKGPSVLTADLGGMLYIPLKYDSEKGIGLVAGGTITPIGIKSMSLGFRAERYLYAGKDIIDSDDKKHEIEIGLAGTFVAKCPLAKSFEVFAGVGAGFVFLNFDSLSDFSQTWGYLFQAGGRGRLYNHLGVGAQFNILFDVPHETRHLTLMGYF